jgi:hypothetical protein
MVRGQANRAGGPSSQTDIWAAQDGQQGIQGGCACSAGFSEQQLAAGQLCQHCSGVIDLCSSSPADACVVGARCSSCGFCGCKQCPVCTASVPFLALYQQVHLDILHCTTAVHTTQCLGLVFCVRCFIAAGHGTLNPSDVGDCYLCNSGARCRPAAAPLAV